MLAELFVLELYLTFRLLVLNYILLVSDKIQK